MNGNEAGSIVAGVSPGLELARLVANLVIVAASLTVARGLWKVASRTADLPATPAHRALLPSAALIVLCGLSHLFVVLAGQAPAPVVSTKMKVMAAALWVMTAVWFPSIVAHLMGPPTLAEGSHGDSDEHGTWTTASEECLQDGLALRAERLRIRARDLETMLAHDVSPLDKDETLRELREILVELEAHPWKS